MPLQHEFRSSDTGLGSNKAIRNVQAIIQVPDFADYNLLSGRISSDMFKIEPIGGSNRDFSPYTIKDLSQPVYHALEAIKSGLLYDVFLKMTPCEAQLRQMGFEDRLFEAEKAFMIPLRMNVRRRLTQEEDKAFIFQAVCLGFDMEWFESNGLDFKDADRKLRTYYLGLEHVLKEILPYQGTIANPKIIF